MWTPPGFWGEVPCFLEATKVIFELPKRAKVGYNGDRETGRTLRGSTTMAFIASTIARHEQRLRRLQSSIDAVDNGLQIAIRVDRRQAFWRSVAMLIGMPSGAAGVLLCGFLFSFWDGMGLWYGMSCIIISSLAIRPACHSIETHQADLQERLLELVIQRQRIHEELADLYKRRDSLFSQTPKNPIDVKSEAA